MEKTWAAAVDRETLVSSWSESGVMECTIKLEVRTGWGEVTTCEAGAPHRSLGDLTADGVGLSLAEAKVLLAALQQRIVQSQIDEYSRAEGLVDELTNARTGKSRRMRWLPRGTQCAARVRAAVLDGRLQAVMPTRAAA